jgi:hypothetical protein
MAEMNYLDFDLLIERAGNKYQARVLNSPAGQASAAFRLPFSDLELENFLLRVGRTRRGVRRLESPEMEAAKTFGGKLFDAVFSDEVRACLRSSLDETSRQGAGLRLRLRLADVPELADVPWEYLYNPSLNRFLTLSAETPLVRYLDLPERIQPLAVQPPLRLLVMIASPSDYPALDVEQEWTRLKDALGDLERRGLIVLERLEEATLAALQRRLRQTEYHVFHFIGHGGFDQQAQDGVLVMEDETGRGRQVSGSYLGTLLHDERTLRLAVLNACEGARASRTDPLAGTAQSLVQQGVPAVIAMQFEITDQAAITIAHEFYSALADDYPVDAALAEARKAIFAQGNDVEWGTPVLYLRSPDGRIFDMAHVSTGAREEAAPAPTPTPAPAPILVPAWLKQWRLIAVVAALAIIIPLAVIIGTNWQAGPTATPPPIPTATSLPTLTPPSPAPAFQVQAVIPPEYIRLAEWEIDPGIKPTEAISGLLRLDRVFYGQLETKKPAYDVRLVVKNASAQSIRLNLEQGFFALEDSRGRTADLIYFCCPASGEVLVPGQEREVQLLFEERPEWGGKGGASVVFLRVRGFLPIVRAAWSIQLLVTAD